MPYIYQRMYTEYNIKLFNIKKVTIDSLYYHYFGSNGRDSITFVISRFADDVSDQIETLLVSTFKEFYKLTLTNGHIIIIE